MCTAGGGWAARCDLKGLSFPEMNEFYISDGVHGQLSCNSVTEEYFKNLSILKSIFIMGLNIQSLHSKFNKLTELVDSLGLKFKPPDVIALQ